MIGALVVSSALSFDVVLDGPVQRDNTATMVGTRARMGRDELLLEDGDLYGVSQAPDGSRQVRRIDVAFDRVIGVVDVDGDGETELVIAVDGEIRALDQETGGTVLAASLRDPAARTYVADLDGDGTTEIIQSGFDTITVESWDADVLGIATAVRAQLIIGNFDGDATLELRASYGAVWEGPTLQLRPDMLPFEDFLSMCDVDGDGDVELLSENHDTFTLDDGRQQLWSHYAAPTIFTTPVGVLHDLDGDGLCEALLPSDDADLNIVLDGFTGVPRALVPAVPDWHCRAWMPADLDGDGVQELYCDGAELAFDTVTNTWIIPDPVPHRNVRAADVDGDGRPEVMSFFDGVMYMHDSDDLELLHTQPFTDSLVTFVDLDGDGSVDLLNGAAGLEVHSWTPPAGFVPTQTLVASATSLANPEWHDLDGDGVEELVYGANLRVVSLRSGSTVWSSTTARWQTEDVDGDGLTEMLAIGGSEFRIHRGYDGAVLYARRGRDFHVIETSGVPVIVVENRAGSSTSLTPLRVTPTGVRELDELTVPTRDVHVSDRRVWYPSAQGVVAWSPVDGTRWLLPHAQFSDELEVIGSHVFLGGQSREVWRLP